MGFSAPESIGAKPPAIKSSVSVDSAAAQDYTRSGNKELNDRMKAAGASARVVEITGSDFCDPAGNPSREERATMTADFFDQFLK